MQMNEWDRTEMGFPRALAEAAAHQYAGVKLSDSGSRQPFMTAASADELMSTWLEVFDESSDSI
jgi:hypothetical protein